MGHTTQDDADLIAACARGDEQALGSLYDRFGKVAYGLALRILRDASLAEDAVQEAFLTVWREAARFDPSRGAASTWIITMVHRRAVDVVRRQARFNALADQLGITESDLVVTETAHDDVETRELGREVRAAVARLSPAEREVLDLAYWRGLTQSEIATVLGIPCGTVKSRTFNALARLQTMLRQDGRTGSVQGHGSVGLSGRR